MLESDLFAKLPLKEMLFLRRCSQKVSIGLGAKLRMWRRGFLSESYLTYGLKDRSYTDYVSDFVRLRKATRINGYYAVMLYDKLYFAKLLECFSDFLAVTYGIVQGGRVCYLGEARCEPVGTLVQFCRGRGAMVLKPLTGSQGRGVFILRAEAGTLTRNGKEIAAEELRAAIKDLDDYLVSEYVAQHDYASAIFRRTPNSIRIMTMWDDEKDKPFIAGAVHRFGTSSSYPVDNWTRGGLSASIDLGTGRMGTAGGKPVGGKLSLERRHPETQMPIEGVVIPRWETIKAQILQMAASVPFIPYIGWDLIVTENGFKVIEGNNCPDILLNQIHGPLLMDGRVRRFYEKRLALLRAIERKGRTYLLPLRL